MTDSNLRELVTQAIDRDWPSFAAEHPNLAQLLDRQLLIEHASAELRGDADFQSAIANAQALGKSAEWMLETIGPIVRRIFNRLLR